MAKQSNTYIHMSDRHTSCRQEHGQTKTTQTDRLRADRSLAKQKQHIQTLCRQEPGQTKTTQTDFVQTGAWPNKATHTYTCQIDILHVDRSLAKQKQHIQTDFMQTGTWPNKNNTYRQTDLVQTGAWPNKATHTYTCQIDRLRADRNMAKQKQHIQTDFMQTGAWPNKQWWFLVGMQLKIATTNEWHNSWYRKLNTKQIMTYQLLPTCAYANWIAEIENKISPIVMTTYCGICQRTDTVGWGLYGNSTFSSWGHMKARSIQDGGVQWTNEHLPISKMAVYKEPMTLSQYPRWWCIKKPMIIF